MRKCQGGSDDFFSDQVQVQVIIFFLYRDQVELADGDALVPVAHFSKEVRIILPEVNSELAFYYVQAFKLDLDDIQVFSTFGSPFLVLMRQV